MNTENDRELLELAAKAAGLNVIRSRLDDPLWRDFLIDGDGLRNRGQKAFPWNPLTDDGDALRLAVKLNISISFGIHASVVNCDIYDWDEEAFLVEVDEDGRKDPYAATRRAIVRAAAAIGKEMK